MMPDYDKGEKRARARFAFLSLSPFFSLREAQAKRLLECERRERARKRRRERQKQRGSVQAFLLLAKKVSSIPPLLDFFFPFFFPRRIAFDFSFFSLSFFHVFTRRIAL